MTRNKINKRELDDLSHAILTLLHPYKPDMALAAMEVAFATAIICSTKTQLAALDQMEESTNNIVTLLDEYPAYKKCHWEHED
jgi:hypothetical protein